MRLRGPRLSQSAELVTRCVCIGGGQDRPAAEGDTDVSSIDFHRHVDLCERVRYRKLRRRADVVLAELGATSPMFAVRRSKAGIANGAVLGWLLVRGVVKQTGSGRLWLDVDRRDRLANGAALRIVAYVAAASLLSGAALAAATGLV